MEGLNAVSPNLSRLLELMARGFWPEDAPSYCHHSFFFGDLNYRLDLPQDVEQEELQIPPSSSLENHGRASL